MELKQISNLILVRQLYIILLIIKDYLSTIKFVVEHGADVNAECASLMTPLYKASGIEYNFEAVKFLLEHRANVNAKCKSRNTPLFHADCVKNNLDTIKFLVDHGADLNVQEENDFTSLYSAIVRLNNENAKLLIELGGDVNIGSKCGKRTFRHLYGKEI